MTQRVALLVGTLQGCVHPRRRRRSPRLAHPRPAVRGLAGPRHLGRPVRRAPRRGRQPVVRARGLAERRPRRDLDPLVARASPTATTGPKVATVWNVTAGLDGLYAGVEPAGLFKSTDGGADVGARRGPDQPPQPARVGPGRRRADPAHDRPPPHRRRRGCGSGSRRSACSRRGTAARPGTTRNKGVRAEFNPENRFPEFGQCVHKLVIAADRRRAAVPAEPLRRLPLDRRRGDLGRDLARACRRDFGFVMTAHPRDPLTVWNIPLTEPEEGRLMPEGAAAVWRTHDGGDTWIRSGDGLPQEDAFVGVLREAMAARHARPGRRLLRDEHGPALRLGRRGPARGPGSRTTCRRSGPSRRTSLPDAGDRPRSSTCRARSSRCSPRRSGGWMRAARRCSR